MSERKVLNKYYPPDFDPIKLVTKSRQLRHQNDRPKKKGPKMMNVRMMMPFTMCCSACHEFCYVGKKFNSRVEKVQGEDYLGIAIWRFYGKCPNCTAEFAFKTDPKNTAYILEFGGVRTYDPHRDASLAETSLRDKIRGELEGDGMKILEHKTYTTANELLDLEQLDELRRLNKRLLHQTDASDTALKQLVAKDKKLNDKDDAIEVEKFLQDIKGSECQFTGTSSGKQLEQLNEESSGEEDFNAALHRLRSKIGIKGSSLQDNGETPVSTPTTHTIPHKMRGDTQTCEGTCGHTSDTGGVGSSSGSGGVGGSSSSVFCSSSSSVGGDTGSGSNGGGDTGSGGGSSGGGSDSVGGSSSGGDSVGGGGSGINTIQTNSNTDILGGSYYDESECINDSVSCVPKKPKYGGLVQVLSNRSMHVGGSKVVLSKIEVRKKLAARSGVFDVGKTGFIKETLEGGD